ncbi:MAG: hypothetical protein LBG20_00060 [Holosporaceae bacterium]|jgi:hypothetical protein|nr:hypothetical protein [Holosporaceae bacterium]
MTIARGIRSLSTGYQRDFADAPDTEENLSTYIMLESGDDECPAMIANAWPDFIMLNASIVPVAISSGATVERIENSRLLSRMNLYGSPQIDQQSHVHNPKFCCSKIMVNFENTGRYLLENDLNTFMSSNFGNYQINMMGSGCIFEKEFLISSDSISEITDQKGILVHENTFAKCKIYPYGGLCEYGMHPRLMESCIFRTTYDGKLLQLRISPLSALRSLGIDPTKDQPLESGYQFVGVKNFSSSQKTNLYDELKSGFCSIEIVNRSNNEKSIYKSNAVLHIPKTNLITINFVKEET